MKNFNLKPKLSVNDLFAQGIRVAMDCSNEKMSLIISDKNLIKFKCNLIEEDYPKNFLKRTQNTIHTQLHLILLKLLYFLGL